MRRKPDMFLVTSAVSAAALAFAPWLVGQPSPARDTSPVDRVAVPAGPFVMGNDHGGEADERPRHTLTLPAFRVDRTEVSNAQYARCVGAGVCTAPRDCGPRTHRPEQPVVGVSWTQARAYCAWTRGRLPTERE
jgi:formylglycine-generating enzyme required for sulfatase activity